MDVITYHTEGNRITAEVRNGGTTAYTTAPYATERMAYADAYCWLAFHGEKESMTKITADPDEVYTGYIQKQDGPRIVTVPTPVTVERVANALAEAERFGLSVDMRRSPAGFRYIEISNGKGSSYSKWWIGEAAQAYLMAPPA
ncbi:hypothetical protein ACIGPN_05970 [Streptomyces afghaniensis]|uniref:hypothetical protein n=1 Tax=Streptomyces afghaniensis TaxID=66865 RepID=UPI0037CF4A4A